MELASVLSTCTDVPVSLDTAGLIAKLVRFGPRLHEYLFIQNDTISNENATIVPHLHPLSYRYHVVFTLVHENDEND